MEVFLRGVPTTLAEQNLKDALAPFLNILGIADWVVDKPKRKPFAWITFLGANDGNKFLERYGQQRAPPDQTQLSSTKLRFPVAAARYIARLDLLSTPIYVVKSRREAKELVINHLSHERDERQKRPERGPRALDISCSISQISCGKIVFGQADTGLKYIQQIQHHIGGGRAKFGSQSVTVHQDGIARMDIPVHTVQQLAFDHTLQSIMLILEDPPKFFAQRTNYDGDDSKWERQTSFPLWTDHAKYVAHCLVYQLTLAGDYLSTTRAVRRHDILTISHRRIPLISSPTPTVEDYATGMSSAPNSADGFLDY